MPFSQQEVARASRAFRDRSAFRSWLERNHARVSELLVRCYKVADSHLGITYREALDEALCFGWIDGVRRSLDGKSFSVRFTPRAPKSNWSRVNSRRARELIAEGRMQPPGLKAYRARVRSSYTFESAEQQLSREFLRLFRAHPRGWAYYSTRPPYYRKITAIWVMTAKKAETRTRRFQTLLRCSARGTTIPSLSPP